MENQQAGQSTSHVPGDDQTHEPGEQGGTTKETLSSDLAEEDVHTQEQRNQQWTSGPSRGDGEAQRPAEAPGATLDMPSELEDKMDEVMANPHSDAQVGGDTGDEDLGGLPKTGSGEQDPMGQTGGGQSGG